MSSLVNFVSAKKCSAGFSAGRHLQLGCMIGRGEPTSLDKPEVTDRLNVQPSITPHGYDEPFQMQEIGLRRGNPDRAFHPLVSSRIAYASL